MAKKRPIKKNKVPLGVTCQCKDHAVARPPTILRRTQCKVCGKIFMTNRELNSGQDICFACKRKK